LPIGITLACKREHERVSQSRGACGKKRVMGEA